MVKSKKIYQLALQGGGAKGCYHAGLIKALKEEGYHFNAVVGTSIGALNAAMIAQGEIDNLYEIWKNIKFSDVLNVDDKHAERLAKKQFGDGSLLYFIKTLAGLYKSKGIETEKIKKIIDENINETKLRKSKIDFGLLTVKNIPKMEPVYIFKDDIPKGYINDYILASARLPGFQKVLINEEEYIDGGVYDNLPVNMLIEKGYKNIIAVRTDLTSIARNQKVDKEAEKDIIYITPSEKPGRVLDFSRDAIQKGIKLGYFDGKKFAKSLYGKKYYIKPFDKDIFLDKIYNRKKELLLQMEEALDIEIDNNFDKTKRYVIVTEKLKKILATEEDKFVDILIEITEMISEDLEIERFQIISFKDLLKETYIKLLDNKKEQKNKKKIIIYKFFKVLMQDIEKII